MEVSGPNVFTCDDEKALICLLDAFGAAFSLEEIASAYCKSSRNVNLAGEILYEMKGSTSTSATTLSSNSDAKAEVSSSESSDGLNVENSGHERKTSRPKNRAVSAGTVSSVIGKGYARPTPTANGSKGPTKPIKLDANALPVTGIWREKSVPNTSKRNSLHQDMEEFLFKMLGDGFQLDRNMIREVLGTCGYDMQKSLDKLLDQSIMALDKKPVVIGDSAGKFTAMKPKSEVPSSEKKSRDLNHPGGDGHKVSIKEGKLPQPQTHDLQQEVLSSLFTYREHREEPPKRIVRDCNNSCSRYGYGHVVYEPPEDSFKEYQIDMNFSRRENEDDAEDEEEYQTVRSAVKEFRMTMKEYYKAAVVAFAEGDQIKAERLLDKGQFFLQKARDADEQCSRMILKTRPTAEQEMVLDLRDHGPKEALRLLKCHLSSLSGISSFEYLKVIIDATEQDNKKKSSRRQVFKLLEQESIKWTEGEEAGTILIRLDNIERRKLSFFKT